MPSERLRSSLTRRASTLLTGFRVGGVAPRHVGGVAYRDGLRTSSQACAPAAGAPRVHARRGSVSWGGGAVPSITRLSWVPPWRLVAGSVSSEVIPGGSPRFGRGTGIVGPPIAAVGLLATRGRHGSCGGSEMGSARFTGLRAARLPSGLGTSCFGQAPPSGSGPSVRFGPLR